METRSARRRRLSNSQHPNGVDFISHLPDALLHHILSLLPIKTIARTATLSTRWCSLWYTLPDLDFSSDSDSGSIFNNSNPADIITHILKSRDHKHSNVRLLRFSATLSFSRLNALFRTAIRHDIQELHVQVTTNDLFNFPRCVIASDSLRVFNLRSVGPGFRLPPPSVMASGFRSLNSLSLIHVVFDFHRSSLLDLFTDSSFPLLKKLNLQSCTMLRHLRVKCPMLENFSLEWCVDLQGLDVFGPKLETLRIYNCFEVFNNPSWVKIAAPNLKTLVWIYNAVTDHVDVDDFKSLNEASLGLLPQQFGNMKLQNVSALLSGISRAHSITLETLCVDVISSNSYFRYYLPAFNDVKYLELQTAFGKHNGPGLANIFRSCPILHTLTIKIDDGSHNGRKVWRTDKWAMIVPEEEQFWETQIEPLKSFLLHLKVVRIKGVIECSNEVSLIQFLLKHGTALHELTLSTSKTNHRDSSLRRREIKSQIMAFPRASSHVKIQYC